jgi:uncharacterized membrane protein YgcG
MSDNQNSNRPVYPKSILDHRSMRLSTEAADQGKWASFSVDVNDVAEIVFKVWPNDSEDASRNRGPIEGRFTQPWFNSILDLLRIAMQMSKKGEKWRDKVEYSDRPWIRGDGGKSERAKDPKPMWAIWVGSDEFGKVWISLQVYKRPNIQFFFGKDTFNNLYHENGQPYSDAEISRAFASGWIAALEQHIPPLVAARYNHEKTLPKNKQGQGGGQQSGGNRNGNYSQGGGNYQNRNQGGGNGGGSSGGSSSAAAADDYSDVEDDMPF